MDIGSFFRIYASRSDAPKSPSEVRAREASDVEEGKEFSGNDEDIGNGEYGGRGEYGLDNGGFRGSERSGTDNFGGRNGRSIESIGSRTLLN